MDLLEFIARSHKIEDDVALWELLRTYVKQYGIDSLIFCLMTDHVSIGESAKHGIITGYPEDWMKHYIASGYEIIDPIRKESMLASQRIFTWEQIDEIRPYNKKERKILNEASECGLKDGVAVSLANHQTERIALGFASSSGGRDLNPETLSLLKLASVQFYDIYQQLKAQKIAHKKRRRIYLSEREREVLQWTAAGKSTPDIATILNISESTVNYFLKQCFTKLEANSKTLVVVKAIRLGLIRLDDDFKVSTVTNVELA